MRYLTLTEALELHTRIIETTGGSSGVRDLDLLKSSLAQPKMTFDGQDLYPTLAEKAATLAFSVINNHPFVDGNKRIAHALLETFLVLNGYELRENAVEQEQIVLALASGLLKREQFAEWVKNHIVRIEEELGE